ncbi:MAG: hypothetical protein KJ578_04810 [Bacteroidetes bacterium]|nr:hypothetical protein [Bacteroidota bacterium]MBU1580339.1 hypothetical protein [Bacteroidota bacterium]MBU2464830.1 hypothetical protein [Bacteroidota bacterium]MBU2557084.1 hypothetical protein [Bacteroidota bacterium]
MKTKHIVLLLGSSLLLFGLFFQSSCNKLKDVTDGAQLIIDYNLIETTVDVQFYDAATGELIGRNGDASVNVKITGADKNGVMDVTGVQSQSMQYATQRGMVGLALLPEAAYTPSATKPISFNLVADIPGYLSTSQKVTLVATGRTQIRVNMVHKDNPPEGVTVARETGVTTAVNGRVENPATVTTPGGRARIEIPAGIILRDAGGNALSGSINMDIVHFDNTVEEALAAFPGGLMTNVTRSDGSEEDGMFYSAGFVAIEITDGSGRQAATFEEGTVAMEAVVSPQTFNPETNGNVAAGDVVPVWSYDENTGEWTEEGTTTLELVNGELTAGFELTHLSYYNFDWFYGAYCYSGVPFVFNATNTTCDCYQMQGAMYRQSDDSFLTYVYMWVCGDEPVYTAYAPGGIPVKIVWDENYYDNVSIAPESQPTMIDDLCAGNPIQINVVTQPSSSITVEVEVYCASEPNVIIRPSFGAWYREINSWNWHWAEMNNGDAEICDVQVGNTYVVGIYYDNNWYETEVTVTQEAYSYVGFELPADVCSEVFGY